MTISAWIRLPLRRVTRKRPPQALCRAEMGRSWRSNAGISVRMSARAWIGGKASVEWRLPRRQLGNPGQNVRTGLKSAKDWANGGLGGGKWVIRIGEGNVEHE